jgi:hypothetical protein
LSSFRKPENSFIRLLSAAQSMEMLFAAISSDCKEAILLIIPSILSRERRMVSDLTSR